jgi:hypothetical protein
MPLLRLNSTQRGDVAMNEQSVLAAVGQIDDRAGRPQPTSARS